MMRRSAADIGSKVMVRPVWATRSATLFAISRRELSRRRRYCSTSRVTRTPSPNSRRTNHTDDELQGVEGLPPPANQQAGVGAGDVKDGAAGFGVIGGADDAGYIDPGGGQDVVQGNQGQVGRAAGFGRGDRSRDGGYGGRDIVRYGISGGIRPGIRNGGGRRGDSGGIAESYPDPGGFAADA